ncbi:MAG: Ribose-phosphate pyrophosphokinase [candidate division WS2 bacterium]|uniref:Ribose-phosphate pyrophosphokinase n=1 Tax=Psychracetigena formicireducens TaxID=2986056 RepID=A0A9E2BH69_PSYF1|nr:Ribose-phosphate pyrophosphokinase [Candidatus Psychracetigena formicireducens]MBT9145488.1 Ribose-phosphate pyrophosphokinase [Candidatus Psychracetigena formicireducens]
MANYDEIKIFSGSGNLELSRKVAKYIGLPLGDIALSNFADGEINVQIKESVRGLDIFLIQSTCRPVNENYMELLIIVDALRRASARSINVITPYFGYARQDRKAKGREPITAKLMANLLTAAGASRMVAVDLHSGQIQGFFDIPLDNLSSLFIFYNYLKKKKLTEVVIASPDPGSIARSRSLAEEFQAPLAVVDKRRPLPNASEVMNVIGEVEGKTVIMLDDMIDTGGTAAQAAIELRNRGAKDMYICATHAVFSGDAIKKLQNCGVTEVIVTDTIPLSENSLSPELTVLSVAPLIGEGIVRIVSHSSISELFEKKVGKEDIPSLFDHT